MARARNIKPAFFKNEDLAELDFATRLCFIGLWTEADREGRLEDRPKRLKMNIFPGDNVDMDKMLDDLARYDFIRRYQVDDMRLIRITKWHLHQSPHHTEKQSILPDEPEQPLFNGEVTVNTRNQDGENPPDSLIPDSLIHSLTREDDFKVPLTPEHNLIRFVDDDDDLLTDQADNSGNPMSDNSGLHHVANSHTQAAHSCTGEHLQFDSQFLLMARTTGLESHYTDENIQDIFNLFRCYKTNAHTLKSHSDWLGLWRTWCQREKTRYAKSKQQPQSPAGSRHGQPGGRSESNTQRALRIAQQSAEKLAGSENPDGY